MKFDEILVSRKDAVATVSLNRPERLNAWTPHMSQELRACFRTLSDDDAIRSIILTGEGRGFCAGADMDALKGIKPGLRRSSGKPPPFDPKSAPGFQGAHTWFPAVPKPVIAAINGPVAGIGFVLALWCDIRFASEEAIFSSAFSRRGLVAEHGISWLLPRLVGIAHAQDILLSARRIDAAEAERIGIVNKTLPAGDLMPHVESYAQMLAEEVSPRSMRIMKRQIWEALGEGLSKAQIIADEEMEKSFLSNDFKEGIASFTEKRQAKFTGD